jgi:agmatinase
MPSKKTPGRKREARKAARLPAPAAQARPHPMPLDALVYPRFEGIPTFMRLPHIADPRELDIALVGVPFDGGTTFRPGARFGPRHIRVQSAMIRPYNPALDVNPFERKRIGDYGDLPVNPLSLEDSYGRIEKGIWPILEAGATPVSVGGDHSITLPLLRAAARRHGPLALVQIDAHSDTWSTYFGSHHSHGTIIRRGIEEGVLVRGAVLQIGIRGQVYGNDDFDFSRQHKIAWITAEEFHREGLAAVRPKLAALRGRPCYLTFDIDSVDPAFAPGTGTPQVGGLSSAQALEIVRALGGLRLVGADLVEVSPPYDSSELTSLLAANLLFEILCLLA